MLSFLSLVSLLVPLGGFNLTLLHHIKRPLADSDVSVAPFQALVEFGHFTHARILLVILVLITRLLFNISSLLVTFLRSRTFTSRAGASHEGVRDGVSNHTPSHASCHRGSEISHHSSGTLSRSRGLGLSLGRGVLGSG